MGVDWTILCDELKQQWEVGRTSVAWTMVHAAPDKEQFTLPGAFQTAAHFFYQVKLHREHLYRGLASERWTSGDQKYWREQCERIGAWGGSCTLEMSADIQWDDRQQEYDEVGSVYPNQEPVKGTPVYKGPPPAVVRLHAPKPRTDYPAVVKPDGSIWLLGEGQIREV